MRDRLLQGFGFATVLFAIAGGGEAHAQFGATGTGFPTAPGGSAMMGTGALSNPYANPYLNPYMNPYMTQQGSTMGRNQTLLYFLAAQQQQGVLANKQVKAKSATKPQVAASSRGPKASEMPNTLMVPGGSASGRFQRSLPAKAKPNHASFMRFDGRFGNNGR